MQSAFEYFIILAVYKLIIIIVIIIIIAIIIIIIIIIIKPIRHQSNPTQVRPSQSNPIQFS